MAQKSSAPASAAVEREVMITRVFNAPRKLVYEAWTDARHVAQWWGPKFFTNPVCELDVRVGGKWHIVMRAPDGAEYPGVGVYKEIVPGERLAFTNIAEDKDGNVMLDGFTTVTFEDFEGKTKLTLVTKMTGLVEGTDRMLAGMEAGWSQSLEKLEALVAAKTKLTMPGEREMVFTREFDAPRELVFRVWTEPKHIENWWGPLGFRTETLEMDVRPGGVWRQVMHGPDGRDYRNRVEYLEVVKPARLVYRLASENQEKPMSHLVTVTFEDVGGKTMLTMRMEFESGAERDRVIQNYHADKGGMQTLGRLAEYLNAQV